MYTLKQLSKEIGVSKAWFYKVEQCFGLRSWASRLSGKKSQYNDEQLRLFRQVYFLRLSGIGYARIKRILDNELLPSERERVERFYNCMTRAYNEVM